MNRIIPTHTVAALVGAVAATFLFSATVVGAWGPGRGTLMGAAAAIAAFTGCLLIAAATAGFRHGQRHSSRGEGRFAGEPAPGAATPGYAPGEGTVESPLLSEQPSARGELASLTASAREMAGAVQAAATSQHDSLGQATAAVDALNDSTRVIAEDAEHLLASAESASSATHEISATIREVAGTTESLDSAADTIHTAVNQIASSLKGVTANLVLLGELTASAGSSAASISSAVQEIRDHARDQANIASEVKEAAATAGLQAMDSTRAGMEKIRQEVFSTNASIEKLSSRSDHIGQIVKVITTIAEETNLLALNAAILAAQSGENGKAFGIIADKVRELARKSAQSTKDIGDIINHVQREIESAGKSIKRSISQVDTGMTLSVEAESVLREIVCKAETSLEMALQVETSVVRQAKNVQLNASAIQNFKKMSEDIKKAVTKQSQSADEISKAVKELRAGTGMVKHTLAEQSKTSASIAETMNDVFTHAQVIANGTRDQYRSAEAILEPMETIRTNAELTIALARDLEELMEDLSGNPPSGEEEPSDPPQPLHLS